MVTLLLSRPAACHWVAGHMTGCTRRTRAPQVVRCAAVERAGSIDNSQSPLSSTLEMLNNAQVFNLRSLDQAEDELEAYCSMLSDDESANRCWDAYEYLETKRKEAEEGCANEIMDTGKPGAACARLQQLEQLTYELIGSGEVSSMVSALATLHKAEKHAQEREEHRKQHGRDAEAVAWVEGEDVMCVMTPEGVKVREALGEPDRRDYLHAIFARADHNHDGKLDMEEFRAAMRMLGDELSGHMVALIGEAMDVHGTMDEEQFIQVVEAEDVASHDKLVALWRQHPIASRWWGEEPPHKWGGVMEG